MTYVFINLCAYNPLFKTFHINLSYTYRHVVTYFISKTIKQLIFFFFFYRNMNTRPNLTIFVCPWISYLLDLGLNFFIRNNREFLPTLKSYHHQANHVLLSAFTASCLVLCFIFTCNSDVCCDVLEHLLLQHWKI